MPVVRQNYVLSADYPLSVSHEAVGSILELETLFFFFVIGGMDESIPALGTKIS